MGMNSNENGLTRLYQKEEFIEILNEKAEKGELSASFCCVFFRIHGFRSFYLRSSFDEGYEVIKFVTNKICNAFPVDFVGTIDDGEYAVITDIDEIETFITRIRKDFDEVYVHTGMTIYAGIYPIAPSDRDGERIVQNARAACKSGKKTGEAIVFFDESQIDDKILMQHYVVHHLESALENGEIAVYYQPIYHTLSGKICGFEALARWNNPEYGFLLPSDFVPVLENSKKIYLLDCFVIKQVCMDERNVIDRGMDPVPVSINLTRLDFAMIDILNVLEEETAKYNIPRYLINIEISENEITAYKQEVKEELQRLHDDGFSIVYDDFGSEYSSLHILNDMPFDCIKINSNFLEGFDNDLRSRIVMKNVLNMAKELGIRTMMGSVENENILEFLKQIGCEKSQGHLFSEARPIKAGIRPEYEFESSIERKFYDEVGAVNILSQTPIDTNSTYLNNEDTYLNTLPLAIMEFSADKFKFLMSSPGFDAIFKALQIGNVNTIEKVFNDPRGIFARQVKNLASQCTDDEIHTMEFVTADGFNRIMLRKITRNTSNDLVAILATAEKMSEDDPSSRAINLNTYVRFLYSIYTRVDIVNVEDNSFANIYENPSNYNVSMEQIAFSDAIRKFADEAIYNEDREDFVEFYNLKSIESKLFEYKVDHITNYFRTKDKNGKYEWLMYIIIPVVSDGSMMFLMCSRTIEAERMRKLPEISQSGSEYYDMPSDPAFLLLASDAFTNTLGYGSFEQFLRNTFYLEASLTDNLTVYMHLGQSGLISDFGETGYLALPFDEVVRGMVFSQVYEEDRDKMYEFYDKGRLLSEYEKGKTSGTIVYLERTGSNVKPRYQTACYHIRRIKDDNIHIYILTYDVDDFTRTNEKIKNLAERDTLTGLYNRMTIGNIIDGIMKDTETKSFGVVLLDLDYFKQVNDRYGHDCGDCVIKDAADRMKKYLGDDSYPARIGGDEFLAIIRNRTSEEMNEILTNFSTMDKIVKYGDQDVKYTMSIGFSMYPRDGEEYNELYQNADQALYIVKMNGKNNYGEYEKGVEVKAERKELGFNPATISEGIPGGFLVYKSDDTEEILFANKQLIEMYECEDLDDFRNFTNNSFKGCVLPEDYEIIEKAIKKEVKKCEDYDYVQYRAVTKSGRHIIVEDFGRLKHSTNDGDLFYVFIVDYEQKKKHYHKIIEDIHKHWKED